MLILWEKYISLSPRALLLLFLLFFLSRWLYVRRSSALLHYCRESSSLPLLVDIVFIIRCMLSSSSPALMFFNFNFILSCCRLFFIISLPLTANALDSFILPASAFCPFPISTRHGCYRDGRVSERERISHPSETLNYNSSSSFTELNVVQMHFEF